MGTGSAARSQTMEVAPVEITEWKAVYGRVEARDTVPARARIGGTVVELLVSEGDSVKAGEKIATVEDEKIAFQIAAIDAQMRATQSKLETAQADLDRTEALVKRGVATVQRLDQLQSEVSVARNGLAALEAQRSVVVKQGEEGAVLAPVEGRVLSVPVTRGAVVMGGEVIATIGGGGFFLRLSIPERHAAMLKDGAALRITSDGVEHEGRLAKIYPQITNGRVTADVEVEGLDTAYVDARLLVEVPVGSRMALLAPRSAVVNRSGIDFVTVKSGDTEVERAVVVGKTVSRDGTDYVEILTGLSAGDVLVVK
ncbi:MAG: efflux RND transporter periplasmic adaptor subunit [Nitratireductor sp.]|nr:efflux RND transporter periplasmic adaptor subunit [Nitratireductor sp.]